MKKVLLWCALLCSTASSFPFWSTTPEPKKPKPSSACRHTAAALLGISATANCSVGAFLLGVGAFKNDSSESLYTRAFALALGATFFATGAASTAGLIILESETEKTFFELFQEEWNKAADRIEKLRENL